MASSPVRLALAVPLALSSLALAGPAWATGMQGHMYMAQCAAEQVTDPRLRAIFDAHALHLANGTMFPDSGYTSPDHDQGEIAHWEQYIQGYVEILRERYAAPLDDPEGAAQAAFMMGAAAHGITDSTFDALLFARAEQVDPGDPDVFDMAMDIFLVHDMPRFYVPDPAFDSQLLSDIYTQKIPHDVQPKAIDQAMSTARIGVSAVSKFLYVGADDYGMKFPWARSHLLDPRTPGGYPHGAKVVMGYYRELLRRLDGDTTADQVVIGTYPEEEYPLVTLDNTRPDGRLIFFFGEGIDRATIDDKAVIITDDQGNVVPATVGVFRGDNWANVVTVEATSAWKPGTKYTAVLQKTIKTLSGVSPSADYTLSFTTCTPLSPGADCAEPQGPAPKSRCPIIDGKYVTQPGTEPEPEPDPVMPDPIEPDPDPGDMNPPGPKATPKVDSGCAVTAPARGSGAWASLAVAIAAGALAWRQRRS